MSLMTNEAHSQMDRSKFVLFTPTNSIMTYFSNFCTRIKSCAVWHNWWSTLVVLTLLAVSSGMNSNVAHAQGTVDKYHIASSSNNEAEIQRDGQSLNTKNVTVLPGQKMNLSLHLVKPVAPNVTVKYTWLIGDTIFSDYTPPSRENSNNWTRIRPVYPEKLLVSNIAFYWSDSGAHRVQCTYEINNVKKTLFVFFNVVKPDYSFVNIHFGSINKVTVNIGEYVGLLNPGDGVFGGEHLGIINQLQVKIPQSYRTVTGDNSEGYIYVTQIQSDKTEFDKDGVKEYNRKYGQVGCDTSALYTLDTAKGAQTTKLPQLVSTGNSIYYQKDGPLLSSSVGDTYQKRKNDFKTYLMFIPPGQDSQPVALSMLTWGFDYTYDRGVNGLEPRNGSVTQYINNQGNGVDVTVQPEWSILQTSENSEDVNVLFNQFGGIVLSNVPRKIDEPQSDYTILCRVDVHVPVANPDGILLRIYDANNNNGSTKLIYPDSVRIAQGETHAEFEVQVKNNDQAGDSLSFLVIASQLLNNDSASDNYTLDRSTVSWIDNDHE